MHSSTFHVQSAQDFSILITGPNPSYLVLKVGDNCPNSNRDTAQNVNLQVMTFKVKVIREVQQYFAMHSTFYPWE